MTISAILEESTEFADAAACHVSQQPAKPKRNETSKSGTIFPWKFLANGSPTVAIKKSHPVSSALWRQSSINCRHRQLETGKNEAKKKKTISPPRRYQPNCPEHKKKRIEVARKWSVVFGCAADLVSFTWGENILHHRSEANGCGYTGRFPKSRSKKKTHNTHTRLSGC